MTSFTAAVGGESSEGEHDMEVRCGPDSGMPNALLATLAGFFDQTGSSEFWEAVAPRLSADVSSVIIDLSGVNLVTSAGVGVLVRLLHRAQALGGSIALTGAGERVSEVIRVVHLHDILKLSGSLEEARQRLKEAG